MRTHILTASLLVVTPLAASCGRASAETPPTATATPSRVFGVAGNCPADSGPMHPASAGAMVDRNGDGYVCTRHIPSIAGDTLHITVDNDAPSADSAQTAMYVFNG